MQDLGSNRDDRRTLNLCGGLNRLWCADFVTGIGVGLVCKVDLRSNRDGRRTLDLLGGQNRLHRLFTLNERLGIESRRSTDHKRIGRPELTLVCRLRHRNWGPPGMQGRLLSESRRPTNPRPIGCPESPAPTLYPKCEIGHRIETADGA